jgi:uncharacterized membrane-anchored protein
MFKEALIGAAPAPVRTMRAALTKVPEATALFWATKLLTTGFGEAAGDWMEHAGIFGQGAPSGPPGPGGSAFDPSQLIPLYVAVAILAATMALQFAWKRYLPAIYWLNILAVSVFGTIGADNLFQSTSLSFTQTSAIFAGLLVVVFAVWYSSERTLSVHSITNPRREAFYWGVVLLTFLLGTAWGDWLTQSIGLTDIAAAGTFALGMLVSGAVYAVFRRPGVGIWTFWIAYVFTRPAGASTADWGQYARNYGHATVALVSLSLIVILVIAQQVRWNKNKKTAEDRLAEVPPALLSDSV